MSLVVILLLIPLTSSGDRLTVVGFKQNIVPSLRRIKTSPSFLAKSNKVARFCRACEYVKIVILNLQNVQIHLLGNIFQVTVESQ